MTKYFLLLVLPALLLGCGKSSDAPAAVDAPEPAATVAAAPTASELLSATLAAEPDEVRARYQYRHPQETIEFFGIEPGMTVVEGLPGGGWYTKVLLPYLGKGGSLIGANYSLDLYPLFDFVNEDYMARQREWTTTFPAEAAEWAGDDGAAVTGAFHFGSMPDEFAGTADVVLMVRALHNLANFENAGEGSFLSEALEDCFRVLKPGGVLGIVQHEAREDMSDEFANGTRGYLKKQFVIERAAAAGFELVAESDINNNPNDQPGADDIVWRLPPTYGTSGDNDAMRSQMDAVGESNRMTLKFVKATN
jgi:predicted methyltransferase